MNNSKTFTFNNVLHILGVVGIGVAGFFGFLYIWKGIEMISGITVLLLAFFSVLLVNLLSRYKAKESKARFKVQEVVLLVCYVIVACFSAPAVFHFINTEFVLKDKIRESANVKIEAIENMQTAFDKAVEVEATDLDRRIGADINGYFNAKTSRYNSYRNKLATEYGMNLSSESLKVDFDFRKILNEQKEEIVKNHKKKITKDLDSFKKDNKAFVEESTSVMNAWQRVKLNNVFYDLDVKMRNNLAFFKERLNSFDYELPAAENMNLSNPMSLIGRKDAIILLPLLVLIIGNILILMPYLRGRRPKRPIYDQTGEIRGTKI